MAEEQLEQIENRLSAVETALEQVATYQTRAFQGLSQLTQVVGQVAEQSLQTQQNLDRLTVRVDSLVAASERYDRILDYLLRRDGQLPPGDGEN
jgi:ABC-type transporter Mla subunit MlaD